MSTSISITPQFGNNTVTAIDCGTSVPKLGGTIDLSAYTNLTDFRCVGNNVTSISGYDSNSNLINFYCGNNLIAGNIPVLSALTQLQIFDCAGNQLSGPIPVLSANKQLIEFRCNVNQLVGSIPSLSGLENFTVFTGDYNYLTGTIPALSSNRKLVEFRCNNQLGGTKITGSIPSLSGLSALEFFECQGNQLTGSIPSLSGSTLLKTFDCAGNQLSGPIPVLSACKQLIVFRINGNFNLTGTIPNLEGLSALTNFVGDYNQLTGNIPSLSSNTSLFEFRCNNQLGGTKITGFDGGIINRELGSFEAQSNQLTQTAVDAILSSFTTSPRTTGTKVINLQAGTNAAPSYTGGVTTTSPGSNFSRTGTTVTANVAGHGHPNGSIVTITGINETAFQGTFTITVVNANQFQYTTVTSGSITGTGTATMRRTTVNTDGFRYYQDLALVTRLGGYPWNVNINFP